MKIIRWDPFKDVMMVDNFLDPALHGGQKEHQCTWSPAVDVYETEKHLVLTAELPGVRQEDISLSIYENVLSLKGDRRFERGVNQENYHRVERSYGRFGRRFTLPFEVENDKITATFKDGVLEVSIPKSPPSRRVRVKVK